MAGGAWGSRAWSAVVLAGGRARRLGGVDKPALVVGERSLLDTVLLACEGAAGIVVVGPPRPTVVDVRWTREDPPHGGPLAALAAGLHAMPEPVEATAVLAADLPGLRTGTLRRLLDTLAEERAGSGWVDGALLVDSAGRPQWLAGVWRTTALRTGLAGIGDPSGQPLRALLGGLPSARLAAIGHEALDIDTHTDLEAHSRHTGRPVT
jgi:molybdopterin-guanine dinucleotide biosynthesis protein A